MRNTFIVFNFIVIACLLFPEVMAQAPGKISYQAVIRNSDNNLVVSAPIGIRISILKGSPTGTEVYKETYSPNPQTNTNGLVSLQIGTGTPVTGTFASIDWSSGPYFIKTETDPNGGTSYSIVGTTELLSVPFALFAKDVENRNDADADPLNELQALSISNDTIRLTNGGFVKLPPTNSFNGNYNSLTNKPYLITSPNVRIGYNAGRVTPSNKMTVAIGDSALFNNGTGASTYNQSNANIAIGRRTLYANTTGHNNVAVGATAMLRNTTGRQNTAIGTVNLYNNTTGSGNTAIGDNSMVYNTTGTNNTATGLAALLSNTTGNSNVAVGNNALYSNTDRGNLVAIGDSALFNNGRNANDDFHANHNTAVGSKALYANTTASGNTALGFRSMMSTTGGSHNTAIGILSLRDNTIGFHNVALGAYSLLYNTIGNKNTSIGYESMYVNTTGDYNTAVGDIALHGNTSGDYNIAIGIQSLYNNTTGASNTSVGSLAMLSNTLGNSNTAVGKEALYSNTSGHNNFAAGNQSLRSNTLGFYNVALGSLALYDAVSSPGNTAIGAFALQRATGAYNTGVGYNAGPSSLTPGVTNATAIGNGTLVTVSNTVRLGNTSVISIGGSVTWSNLSDGRFKTNIKSNVPGLDFILKLRPVTYTWNLHKLNAFLGLDVDKETEASLTAKEQKVYTGFVAQEVEKAASEVGFDFSGIIKPENEQSQYNLSYAEFVAPLVQAVQELNKEVEALKSEIKTLQAALKD